MDPSLVLEYIQLMMLRWRAAGLKDIASDFIEIALSQGAIAPAAQVKELRQNWIEAMAPVVTLQAQVAELDKLAEPVRPYQAMQGEQGTVWYDSVNPLRLAELEGQMAPLQQQALDLRAKARAQFEAELKGIEGVGAGAGTGNKPQTALELQFIKEAMMNDLSLRKFEITAKLKPEADWIDVLSAGDREKVLAARRRDPLKASAPGAMNAVSGVDKEGKE